MAIARMNSFFARHHRVIFGVITIIIIVAFTDFLTPGTGIVEAFRGNGRAQSAGEIFGSRVGYMELGEQTRLDMLSAQVFMGIPLNASMREQLEAQAFYTLANLEAAAKAGLQVSDEEVGRFLRLFFRDEAGKFNADAYRNFVENYLAAEGFAEADLNTAARQYLLLAKLQDGQRAAVVVTPGEVELFYNMLHEEFEVLSGDFSAADFAKSVKVEPAELTAFFQANRGKYVIPAQLEALVVEFPYDQFRSEAIKSVNDAAIKAFYDKNPALFSKVENGKVEVKPFAAVKNEARSLAIANTARDLAAAKAQQFGATVYEAVGNAPVEQRKAVFVKLAGAAKLAPKTTGRFAADSKAAGTVAEPALVTELAGVFVDVPVSNAVPGEKAAYIGYVTEFVPSREAELNEMQKRITADFVREKSLAAARERAVEVAQALKALPAAGRIARVQGMTAPRFKALKKFTPMTGSKELPGYVAAVVGGLLPGEVSDAIPTGDGARVLMVLHRTLPAKPQAADAALESMVRNYKLALAQSEYQAWLAANCVRYAQPQDAQPQTVAE